jgi:hypothetical protein
VSWALEGAVLSAEDERTVYVQHSALPESDFDGIAGLASWHRGALEERHPEARFEDIEPASLAGEPVLEQRYATATRTGLAAYTAAGGDLHWVVAEADTDADVELLRRAAAAWLRDRLSVRLTALEVRVLSELLRVPGMHFIGAAWYPGLDSEARSRLAEEVLAGLAIRGLVRTTDGAPPAPAEGVLELVRPVLDADLISTVSWSAGDSPTRTIVVGSAGGRFVLLHDEGPGRLRFARIEGDAAAERVLAITTPPALRVATGEETLAADEVRSDEATIVAVTAVRRAPDGLESDELSWRVAGDGSLARISIGAEGRYHLAPLAPDELRSALQEILTPVG